MTTFLGLGSNIGDSRATFRAALAFLNERGAAKVVAVSSLYGSKAFGVTEQPDFTNAVVEAETSLSARELLHECKAVEQALGRQLSYRWGPRLIDIDVLLYDNEHIESPELTIPHAGLMVRPFVLTPLAEIAPGLMLPDGANALHAARSLGATDLWVVEDQKWHQ